MDRTGRDPSRRRFIESVTFAGLSFVALPDALFAHRRSGAMRIGIIGSGRMGGAVGIRWAEAGHEVLFSSRHPEELVDLVAQAGARAQAGLPEEAAEFGEVVLIAVPYGALPQVGQDYAHLMRGKVVIDLCNPRADRDGPMADDAIARGTGVASAEYLPGVRLVRALNTLSYIMVEREAHRDGPLIGVPVAGDDPEAVATATTLVRDAGFEPVLVGGLERAREFDRGTEVYVTGMTAAEIRETLGLESPPSG
jgi:predicted dinucleotide-binding enzyme